MIIHITLTEEQKQEAARELDLNSLLNIVLSKTMSNKETIELGMKIQEYLTNEGRERQQEEVINIIMCAYKGKNAWYLMHPKELVISSQYTKEFHSKKELEKYCKTNKIEFKVIDVL